MINTDESTLLNGENMAVYRPSKDKKKALEDVLRDLDPGTRELARAVIENMILEEKQELTRDELIKLIEKYKKKQKETG